MVGYHFHRPGNCHREFCCIHSPSGTVLTSAFGKLRKRVWMARCFWCAEGNTNDVGGSASIIDYAEERSFSASDALRGVKQAACIWIRSHVSNDISTWYSSNFVAVTEVMISGFLAVSLVESTVIFIRLPSVASEMPETSSWLRTLHHAIMIPFRVLFYLFSRLGAQQKTALYPEDEMEPLASSTDIQEPKHSHKRHCAEEEDGIRVRPMPEFIGNERPPDY